MRRGMNSLAVHVQQGLGRDPHAGDLYVFRGKRGHLIKILWHDGIGMSLYIKRLEKGRFIWPSPVGGAVAITPAQLAYMLKGIVWTPSAGQERFLCGRPPRVKSAFESELPYRAAGLCGRPPRVKSAFESELPYRAAGLCSACSCGHIAAGPDGCPPPEAPISISR
jgi:transposase